MPDLRRVGAAGEDRAADYLLAKGYTIVTRRWTAKGGELDLVVLDGDILVFVEVKSRGGRWMTPEEALTQVKIERFLTAVRAYCNENGETERPVRYDVVAIDDKGIRHYEDAFRA